MEPGDLFLIVTDHSYIDYIGIGSEEVSVGHRDKDVYGPYRVLKEFDVGLRDDLGFDIADFCSYLKDEGYIEHIKSHVWHIYDRDGKQSSETCLEQMGELI